MTAPLRPSDAAPRATSDELRRVFLAGLAPSLRAGYSGSEGLGTWLRDTAASAAAEHPTLGVPAAEFVAHLAARARPGGAGARGSPSPHAADLFLACACARGDPRACALLEARHVPAATALARLLREAPDFAREVRQRFCISLFVPQADAPAGISTYAGESSLAAWIRAGLFFTAAKMRREAQREQARRTNFGAGLGAVPSDPETAYFRRAYAPAVQAAFDEALEALPPRVKNVLRLHLQSGVALEALAASYGVHRATLWRWLTAGCAEVLERLNAALAVKLAASDSEVASLVRLLASQLDASLGPSAPGPP